MLQVLKNEKFLKYGRILFEVVRALYFIGAILAGLFYLLMLADPNDSHTPQQMACYGFEKLLFRTPYIIAFLAYIFAVFSYNKRQFLARATWISLSMTVVFFIMSIIYSLIPFRHQLETGSMYIFFASTFWGMVGLCLPKDCFLDHQPTRTTQVLRIIFYFILLFTYCAFLLYYIFG